MACSVCWPYNILLIFYNQLLSAGAGVIFSNSFVPGRSLSMEMS